ncbi:Transposase mutator family [Burkholderia pseudomallei]|nr:Transposase mutator family [Burkholderia pseudomallei]
MPRKRKEEVTIEPSKGLNLDPELIKQLAPGTPERAMLDEQLAALKKAIFERAPGGELTHHLGDEKGDAKPAGSTNHRNGTSRKRVATDDDLLDVEIARDREGTFDPVLIARGERRFTGFDDKIIAMYARGMSVREIQGFCWRGILKRLATSGSTRRCRARSWSNVSMGARASTNRFASRSTCYRASRFSI